MQYALLAALRTLQSAKVESASIDARLLMQHVLGCTREELLLRQDTPLNALQAAQYENLVAQRAARKPLAQLIGKREFWSLDFIVNEHTLIPRADSETLVEAVLESLYHRAKKQRILDLGTGTGCLILTLLSELPNASGVGVDISEAALRVALANAQQLGLKNRVEFVKSDWQSGITGVFDIVVSNPPYIESEKIPMLTPEVARYEPLLALCGGEDGLSCYRTIFKALPKLLAPDGLAFFEIGQGQEVLLAEMLAENHLRLVGTRRDLAGVTRCLILANKDVPSAK